MKTYGPFHMGHAAGSRSQTGKQLLHQNIHVVRGVVGYRQGRRESVDYLEELEYHKDEFWHLG